jgi:hypothetical protein
MHNVRSVLLAVLNLYVRIEIRVATFDTDHSVADGTQSIAAPTQKFPHSAVKSITTARHGQSRRVRRNDNIID